MEDSVLSTEPQAAAAAASEAAESAAKSRPTNVVLLERILSSLDDDKAEDVVQIDLRGKTAIADFMVIATGRSSRQVAGIAEKLTDRLKQEYGILSKVEGRDTGDWVLIDTGDVIVHLFRPEVREFYQIEKLWQPGVTPGQSET
ncbi:ribosome silencing factor [Pseudophaeobacter arcticus]|jgi:ribosome-associated protein|uniref:ribosome silencing factor n=1 Tax=Pseudophaeobacter arcticus TaxID=385492 RepID=UPI0004213150|nr:ribosome silencing factor [Pseudophaeobacter arcticus]